MSSLAISPHRTRTPRIFRLGAAPHKRHPGRMGDLAFVDTALWQSQGGLSWDLLEVTQSELGLLYAQAHHAGLIEDVRPTSSSRAVSAPARA